MSKILEGIRVVELGSHIAVPKATRVLADWGAEVIKVEPPKGDIWRITGIEWDVPATPDNAPLFQTENANKKSIALNLKDPKGKEALLRLLETADVFVTNTRPAALQRLGLDYETLKSRYPKLIYAHFTAYGLVGPDKDMPGFDVAAFWSNSGVLLEWLAGGKPFRPFPGGFGDSACSSVILSGVLGALLNRNKTGKGDYLTASLYGTALWLDSNGVVMGQPRYGRTYPLTEDKLPNALCMLYQTADGDWISTGSSRYEHFAPKVFQMLGQQEHADDPAYVTLNGSRKNLGQVIRAMQEGYHTMSTADVVAGLTEIGLVHARVKSPAEVYQDEQAWANGYLHKLTLENGDELVLPTSPVQFASQEPFPYKLSPQVGDHTETVLKELGYSETEIRDLEQSGAAVAHPC